MSKLERIENIVNLIQKNDFISPKKLSKEMRVSIATIRRDLKSLTEKKIIEKEYNNIRMVTNYNKIFYERYKTNLKQKKIIADLAQKFIQPEDTIFLDTSTTCYELARKLVYSKKPLFIVTNNLYTAIELMNNENINLVLIGGKTRKGYYSTVGPLAEAMISNIKVDKLFFSCTGLDNNGTYEPSNLEGNIKLKYIENSRHRYLLADSSKFNRASITKTANLHDIDFLITEKELSNDLMNLFKKFNIKSIFPSE